MKLYVVFSIENQYDQPENNLHALFVNKPNYEDLKTLFFEDREVEYFTKADELLLSELLKDKEVRHYNTDYRIEEIEAIDNVGIF